MGFFKKKKKKEAAAVATAGAMNGELLAVLGAAVAASRSDEHVAVIAAALAAYEDSGASSDLYIRKIDRTAGVVPAWGVMGNREQIATRMF
ncbi:MAG: hypothetical protein LBS67_05005 [Clostridiales Family XIII bacterium]|jgi:hypothetical protein|nr:hypothetical protein [Clostridiales Family XIII bacterium]